ncbi:hypothetical protein RD792_004155 [Penstemon davidsonii]|uniref:Uncharacterized protein n=1 Tax=Penstemon davidsonii TaxID=160366 RepID=A0ABR0DGP8_9LAMI|nr:hypothetical protein RD792_004155 [Penstemon davidsonii]
MVVLATVVLVLRTATVELRGRWYYGGVYFVAEVLRWYGGGGATRVQGPRKRRRRNFRLEKLDCGFGSFLLGLNKRTYEQAGVDTVGNTPGSYREPGLDWMIAFLFASSFVGILAIVPLRKIMIIDYKLTYPSGIATAVLINGFHTSKGNKDAKYAYIFFIYIYIYSASYLRQIN